MGVFAYEPSLEMAFSNDPAFPTEHHEAAERSDHSGVLKIDEWQTYYARFYTDEIPLVIENSRYVVKKINPGLLEVNFRNFVGLSRIGDLHLEIRNRKISAELYQSMLNEITDHYSSLVFSFGTPVGQHYDKSTVGRDSTFVEYLFLKKYLLDQNPDIEALGNILAYDPHRRLISELRNCSIDQCQYVGEKILHQLLSAPMDKISSNHPLSQTSLGRALSCETRGNFFPMNGIQEVKSFSLDTNENRFVKFFLEDLLGKVEELEGSLCLGESSYFNPDIEKTLSTLSGKISRVLDHNMWRDIGNMRFVACNSQVLQRKEGYRQLFSLFSLLQLATSCDFLKTDFQNLIEIKDLPTIYEYWCFFQVKIVMESLATTVSVTKFVNETPVSHNLTSGLCLEYDNGSKLFFNKTFSGSSGYDDMLDAPVHYHPEGDSYSHNYRPDIVIEMGSRKLLLDAKYKGKLSGFYGEENDGTVQVWKDEDLDKMHCYRDAIKGVEGSFILYPGVHSRFFPCCHADSFYCGIGALALRPAVNGKIDLNCQNQLKRVVSEFIQPTQ